MPVASGIRSTTWAFCSSKTRTAAGYDLSLIHISRAPLELWIELGIAPLDATVDGVQFRMPQRGRATGLVEAPAKSEMTPESRSQTRFIVRELSLIHIWCDAQLDPQLKRGAGFRYRLRGFELEAV